MFVTGIVNARLDEYRNMIVIPKSAVLWTGDRSIVYVKQANIDEPVFKMREIGLGPMLGNSYVVTDGLTEGEEIVTQGAFSIDAAAQLEGKPSMMNSGDVNSSTGQENHSGNHQTPKPVKISSNIDIKLQLNGVVDQYLTLTDAFVKSDRDIVKQAAQNVQNSLFKIDMKILVGVQHEHWMNSFVKLDGFLKSIASSNDIEEQRKFFSAFTNELYEVLKTFGLKDKTLFYQFCPMAFSDKGAYWFSSTIEIRNPYFGEKMLTCGDTWETLVF
jgi:Cu(I)/Ag(I) efflux system membrane fusion protein